MTFQGSFPKPGKRRKSKPKAKTAEKVIQAQVEHLLKIYDLSYLRLPDSLYRAIFANQSVPVYIKKAISDSIKGFPDICVFDKLTKRFLALELKNETGKTSQAQRKWQRDIGVTVCNGFDEAKEAIEKFRKETDD